MKGKFLVPPALRKGHNPYIHSDAKESVKEAGGFIKKNFNPKDPLFVKDEKNGRNINNLWSGYKLGGKGNLLFTGSVLAGGAMMVPNPDSFQNSYNRKMTVEQQSQSQDVESLISTRSDGVGYQTPLPSTSDMNASGDLVFAMHRTRHTGQF